MCHGSAALGSHVASRGTWHEARGLTRHAHPQVARYAFMRLSKLVVPLALLGEPLAIDAPTLQCILWLGACERRRATWF
jgi:hypothetical protein